MFTAMILLGGAAFTLVKLAKLVSAHPQTSAKAAKGAFDFLRKL